MQDLVSRLSRTCEEARARLENTSVFLHCSQSRDHVPDDPHDSATSYWALTLSGNDFRRVWHAAAVTYPMEHSEEKSGSREESIIAADTLFNTNTTLVKEIWESPHQPLTEQQTLNVFRQANYTTAALVMAADAICTQLDATHSWEVLTNSSLATTCAAYDALQPADNRRFWFITPAGVALDDPAEIDPNASHSLCKMLTSPENVVKALPAKHLIQEDVHDDKELLQWTNQKASEILEDYVHREIDDFEPALLNSLPNHFRLGTKACFMLRFDFLSRFLSFRCNLPSEFGTKAGMVSSRKPNASRCESFA